jgi:hypothetical protein
VCRFYKEENSETRKPEPFYGRWVSFDHRIPSAFDRNVSFLKNEKDRRLLLSNIKTKRQIKNCCENEVQKLEWRRENILYFVHKNFSSLMKNKNYLRNLYKNSEDCHERV